jgi:hypothetical protein
MCEIFYIVALNTIKDKSILTTRYPVEDYHNIYPSLMNIIPFTKTGKAEIEGQIYPRFPIITQEDLSSKNIGSKFIDTFKVFPSYLSYLQGDYDGDTVSIQGVFTKDSGSKEFIGSSGNIVEKG